MSTHGPHLPSNTEQVLHLDTPLNLNAIPVSAVTLETWAPAAVEHLPEVPTSNNATVLEHPKKTPLHQEQQVSKSITSSLSLDKQSKSMPWPTNSHTLLKNVLREINFHDTTP